MNDLAIYRFIQITYDKVKNPIQWRHKFVTMNDNTIYLKLINDTTGELWWEPIPADMIIEYLNLDFCSDCTKTK